MDENVRLKVEKFFGRYPIKKIDKKQILIYAGEEPRGIYNIVSGNVRQYDINKKGNEQVLNVFKPPAFFPMDWAITKTPNKYFYEAYTVVEVRLAPVREVVKFLKNNPDVMFDLLSRVYSGMYGLQRRMSLLMGGDVAERVLFEILLECRRFGDLAKDGSYVLKIHEDEIANRAGLTRETVSRQLKLLKEQGLLDVSHKSINIKDIRLLEKALG